MTYMLEMLKHPPNNKKRVTITLSEKTFKLLEDELIIAKKIDNSWNRSNLIDEILLKYLTR